MSATSLNVRSLVVVALSLGMLIPLFFVSGLVSERQTYYHQAVSDVAAAWGGGQRLAGPFLVVPEVHWKAEKENSHIVRKSTRQLRVFLPKTLTIVGDLKHEARRRGIYEVPVYNAALSVSSTFHLAAVAQQSNPNGEILWDEARLVVGLSDTTGIAELAGQYSLGDEVEFQAGTGLNWLGAGFQIPTHLLQNSADEQNAVAFSFDFKLRLQGTNYLQFMPVGAATEVKMSSTWSHPSFQGRYLPTTYTISDAGFNAIWRVSELARGSVNQWLVGSGADPFVDGHPPQAEVGLFQPITNYTVIDRGIKYAFLFVGLTFLAYLCFELRIGVQLHYVQYAVVGGGLVLFYLTLLSLSEHITFAFAYAIATVVLSCLISWYTWAVTRTYVGSVLAVIIGALLTGLYAVLYVLLMLEDFALLAGTAILLLALGALMYATKDLTIGDQEASLA